MNTIKEKVTYIEVIKKSKFITFLHPISSNEEAKSIIDTYKNNYKEATHVCYGYILDENTYKYYDDGEPSNSAGLPIYQVLKNNKLVYILCIVIRYYGGIKLGVGGLNHAYSNGAIEALKLACIIEHKIKNEYLIEMNYSEFDHLNYFLEKKGIAINDKQFLDNIYISIYLDEEELSILKENFPLLSITLTKPI